MYQTLKATVREGNIELLEEAVLPENALLLITVVEDVQPEALSLGEHILRGLSDIERRRVTKIRTATALKQHLDALFDDV